ncbi:MAG: hypothetical protein WA323_10925 [Candidatus Nitrosopolaris sp.]
MVCIKFPGTSSLTPLDAFGSHVVQLYGECQLPRLRGKASLRPNGLPIAITVSPTSRLDEFPNTSGLREDNSCR